MTGRSHPEHLLLSAVLRRQDPDLVLSLNDAHFSSTGYRAEWDFVKRHTKRHGQVPSEVVVTAKFKNFEVLDAPDAIEFYIDQAREGHKLDALIRATAHVDRLAGAGGPTDELFAAMRRELDTYEATFGPSAPAPGEPARRLRLTQASAIPRRRKRWVWDGRIPAGSLTLIPGREGIGKSLFLAWLAAKLTRGELPGIHHGTPKPVIYAATEDSWTYTIANRLVAAGADLDLVSRVDVVDGEAVLPLTLPADCGALTVELQRTGAALLALDPLVSNIAAGIDTHRDRELRTALEPLVAVADGTGAAVCGLAHFGKSKSGDAMDLVLGSRAFSAVTRAALAMARDPDADDGSCVMTQAKNNLGRLDLPSLRYVIDSVTVDTDEGPTDEGRLRFDGESERSVHDILEDLDDADARTERDECAKWLKDYLKERGGEADAADIIKDAEKDGHAKRTIQRARHQARIISERTGFPSRAVWRLLSSVAPPSRTGTGGTTGTTVAPLGVAPL